MSGTSEDMSVLTLVQVGVRQAAAQLLDDVDGVQVAGALQPDDGVHRQLGKVLFVVGQQFGGQRRPGDVQQVLLETGRVVATDTAARKGVEEGKKAAARKESAAALTCGRPPPPSGRRAPPAWPSSSPR